MCDDDYSSDDDYLGDDDSSGDEDSSDFPHIDEFHEALKAARESGDSVPSYFEWHMEHYGNFGL